MRPDPADTHLPPFLNVPQVVFLSRYPFKTPMNYAGRTWRYAHWISRGRTEA